MVLYSFMRQHWPITIAWIWFNIVCILYCTRQYYIRQYQVLCHFRYHGLPFFLFSYYRDAVSISRIGLGLQWDFRLRIQLLCFLWRKFSIFYNWMYARCSQQSSICKKRVAVVDMSACFLFYYHRVPISICRIASWLQQDCGLHLAHTTSVHQ